MTKTAQPKPSLLKSPWIPGILFVGLATVSVLYLGGYITLPHIGGDLVYETQHDAVIGVPYSLNFAPMVVI